MTPQIYLIAPEDAAPETFPETLSDILDGGAVAALLLPASGKTEAQYQALAEAVIPVAQSKDCAVLLDDTPALAKAVGADGVHMRGNLRELKDVLGALQPEMIVGASSGASRHDAMLKGEAGADYVLFGPLDGDTPPDAYENAKWWAETFEVPCVLALPVAALDALDAPGCEFVALGGNVFNASDPARAVADAIARLAGAS